MRNEIQFSKVLRLLIRSRKVSQKDLSRATGISESSISNYLKSNEKPSIDRAILISRYFGVSLDYLLLGQENRHQPIEAIDLFRTTSSISNQLQSKIESQTNLIAKMSSLLFTEMRTVADQLAENYKLSSENMVSEAQYWQLEECSLVVKCQSPLLDDDFIYDQSTGTIQAGPTLAGTTDTLLKEKNYRFEYLYDINFLPSNLRPELQKILIEKSNAEVANRGEFRASSEPIAGYLLLLLIDKDRLISRFPQLHVVVKNWMYEDWIGITSSPTSNPQNNFLMGKNMLKLPKKHSITGGVEPKVIKKISLETYI